MNHRSRLKHHTTMINPYHNRDTTNRNVRLAERGARYIATITTSLGAFVWGQDLAARYLPLEWSATPYLCVATGLLAGAETLWAAAGLSHRLHMERFAPVRSGAGRLGASGEGGTVTFARSGAAIEPVGAG